MSLSVPNPPIVEAILNIQCDFPDGYNFESALKGIEDEMSTRYPTNKPVFFQEGLIENQREAKGLSISMKGGLHGQQYFTTDEKQLVQFTRPGFVFNRLKPYSALGDYLQEIWDIWTIYRRAFAPSNIRQVSLRYINRFPLPPRADGRIELNDFFKIGPQVADEGRLTILGFLNQYTARDSESGYIVNSVLTHDPNTQEEFVVIFDNSAIAEGPIPADSSDDDLFKIIYGLRELKNHIFERTLTKQCLELFQ